MRTLGYVTAITMAAAGMALGLVAVRSLPDARRYVAMRKMLVIHRRPGLMLPAVALHVPADQMPGRRSFRSMIYSTGRPQVGHRTARR